MQYLIESFSQSHTLPNGQEECPVCYFAALEIPKDPDVLQTVLSTANPIDDTVRHSLLAGLDATRSVSDDIDKCMSAMQAIFEQMQSAKDSCALTIEKYEAAMHPIRSLPDDILLAIFQWHILLPTVMYYVNHNRIYLQPSTWTLSRVCRRWRALTLSSPLLWRDIIISPGNDHLESSVPLDVTVQRWKTQLERSGNCDLSIRIIGRGTTVWLDGIIQLFMPAMSRCQSLDIVSTSIDILAPLVTCSFERLTALTWKWDLIDWKSYEDGSAEVLSLFKHASNIRCLTLHTPVKVDLKWEGIRKYSCGIHGIQNLHNLTALECLTLDLTPPLDRTGAPHLITTDTVPFSLTNLRSLSMMESSSKFSYMRQISRLLRLPSLTSLVIISENTHLPEFPEPLPLLRNLSIISSASSSEISVFLAAHRGITELSTGSLSVLRLLHVAGGHAALLPNLTDLYIDANIVIDSPRPVTPVLESRCGDDRDVAHLRKLTIFGAEKAQRRAKNEISRDFILMERWTALCGKINVVGADDNVLNSVSLPM